MSLEQEIASLTAACNRLTEETVKSISTAQVELRTAMGLFNTHFIMEPTILNVGPSRPLTTIQAAWNSLWGKIINAPVTIQVDAGVYYENLNLSDQPYAHNIRIQGAGIDQTVIQSKEHGFVSIMFCRNVRALIVSGFTLRGLYDSKTMLEEKDVSTQGIFACDQSYIYVPSGTLKLESCWTALYANPTSAIYSQNVKIEKGKHFAVADGGYINVEDGDFSGCGQEVPSVGIYSANRGYIVANRAKVSHVELAFHSERSSFLLAHEAYAVNCRVGFHTVWNGSMFAHYATAELTGCGYLSEYCSTIYADQSQAKNSSTGYAADYNGTLFAGSTKVENCKVAYYAHSFGLMEAFGTSKNAKNISEKVYSPPLFATLGNENAMIRWS